jgi:hypothetical protein
MASKHQYKYGKAAPPKNPTSPTNKTEEEAIDLRYMGSREEAATTRTIDSRRRIRNQMNDEIENFLAKGGTIDHIEPNTTADPPKRPSSHYGQRPL